MVKYHDLKGLEGCHHSQLLKFKTCKGLSPIWTGDSRSGLGTESDTHPSHQADHEAGEAS